MGSWDRLFDVDSRLMHRLGKRPPAEAETDYYD
jgi:hypothetical protein